MSEIKHKNVEKFAQSISYLLNNKKNQTHMTNADLGRELNLDDHYVGRIISGKFKPGLATVCIVADYLGMTLDELLHAYDNRKK